MRMTKDYIQGYCDSIIQMNEGLDYRLKVKANVHITFFDTMDITINWVESYDLVTKEEIGGYMVFSDRKDIQSLGFDLSSFLNDQLSKIKLTK